ncbi:hypothetical protein [Siphonobacter curvatus]|uniref:Uncharacterized protein n=1 Tax=Siphonobacter curvatus TaxID=2094562 RepID=A0A2S7IPN2_9BACT|nr:hypothetical protein [Siphonobacter curvatus]PQA59677.1 hypothetical protein C5O19_08600 [Siphonobacter curvatus]
MKLELRDSLRGGVDKTIKQICWVNFDDGLEKGAEPSEQVLISFEDSEVLLVIEDALDGERIDVCLEKTLMVNKAKELTVPGRCKVCEVSGSEMEYQLIGKKVDQILYSKDRKEFVINSQTISGNLDKCVGIQILCGSLRWMIFNNGVGIYSGINAPYVPCFEETYEWFNTV